MWDTQNNLLFSKAGLSTDAKGNLTVSNVTNVPDDTTTSLILRIKTLGGLQIKKVVTGIFKNTQTGKIRFGDFDGDGGISRSEVEKAAKYLGTQLEGMSDVEPVDLQRVLEVLAGYVRDLKDQ